MKPKEIRDKETTAIDLELGEAQKRLFDLRTQATTEKVEDTSQFGKLRRDIARMRTILAQRTREQAKAAAK